MRALPFTTFGEIAHLGLAARVWCCACKSWGSVDAADARWADRPFAGARLRCSKARIDGQICRGIGALSIAPPGRINPGSGISHAVLHCTRCVPCWEIVDVRYDLPPWPALARGERFRCPGCRGPVAMVFHGGPGIPYTARFEEKPSSVEEP